MECRYRLEIWDGCEGENALHPPKDPAPKSISRAPLMISTCTSFQVHYMVAIRNRFMKVMNEIAVVT